MKMSSLDRWLVLIARISIFVQISIGVNEFAKDHVLNTIISAFIAAVCWNFIVVTENKPPETRIAWCNYCSGSDLRGTDDCSFPENCKQGQV